MITHPRLPHAIMALRPGSKPRVDFIVEDFGGGPTLKEGSMKDPPTQEEVDAVTEGQLDAAQASKAPKDPVRLLLADVASLKERLDTAEAAVADVASIKSRLTQVERVRGAPVVLEEPGPTIVDG